MEQKKKIIIFIFFADVPRSFWIGLSLANLPTPQLRWVNGDPLNYTNWNNEDEVEQVTNDNEACIVMGHPCCAGNLTNYAWFSVDCNDQFSTTGHPSYICQRPKGRHFINCSYIVTYAVNIMMYKVKLT